MTRNVDLPYLQPVLYPGGLEVFRRVRSAVLPLRCPVCGHVVWRLDEGALGFPLKVCPCTFGDASWHGRRFAGHALHGLRKLRASGLLTAHPDWEESWPDSAISFDLVRRINPRKGDALKPSTIKGYATAAATLIEHVSKLDAAFGQGVWGTHCIRWDGAPLDPWVHGANLPGAIEV